MQFCTSHGPDHVNHAAQSYKDVIDYDILRGQHNVKLLEKANDRVRNKIQAKTKAEKNKKSILRSQIAEIQRIVEEKDEQASVRTKHKKEDLEENIAKNAKFIKRVEEHCEKRSSSLKISASDSFCDVKLQPDVKVSHRLPDCVDWDEYEIGSTIPINKKAKLINGLSIHDQQLKNAVDRIISLANNCDNGRASKHVNFDVDIVQELNTSHYWKNLHKLIEIYNLPTDEETKKMMSGNLGGNTNESNYRRLNFISKICQLLREANILKAEKRHCFFFMHLQSFHPPCIFLV
jgi:hypothetical protein